MTLGARSANTENHKEGEKLQLQLHDCVPRQRCWAMWLTGIWSWSESSSEVLWKKIMTTEMGVISKPSVHLSLIASASCCESRGNVVKRGTLRLHNLHLHTLQEDIRVLVNGGVWIIMNKGKIMIIINGLGGGGRVNGNAFHSPL